MKKRLLALLLALVFAAGLSACGTAPGSDAIVQLPVAEPGAELTQAPAAPPAEEPTETVTAPPAEEPAETVTAPPAEEPTETVTAPPEEPTETVTAPPEEPAEEPAVSEDGWYNSKEDVALYVHLYGHLPENYVTKREAQAEGWTGGSVEPYTREGTALGGSRFGNYEGLLPEAEGRTYTECDIDTVGRSSRGAKRVVFSNDGLVYYTGDHYESFELLYGGPEE